MCLTNNKQRVLAELILPPPPTHTHTPKILAFLPAPANCQHVPSLMLLECYSMARYSTRKVYKKLAKGEIRTRVPSFHLIT
jgi:hypothetical protein